MQIFKNRELRMKGFFKRFVLPIYIRKPKVDFIKDLPVELSLIILSKLDNQSLLNAAKVSTNWLSVCKSSSQLKMRLKRQIEFCSNDNASVYDSCLDYRSPNYCWRSPLRACEIYYSNMSMF